MSPRTRSVFPLVPRFRVSGLPFGGVTSLRRGHGSDVAGSRAYVAGDPLSTIDWRASARLSTARNRDEFIVRERYAEESARVVVLCDLGPSMGLYPPPFPWLSKPAVVRSATELILASALAAHAAVAYLDFAGAAGRGETPYWIPPRAHGIVAIERRQAELEAFDAPADSLERGLEFLARFRSELSSGTFIFVISDFLGSPLPDSAVLEATARRWELVPVVVQDPIWETSFPLVGPLVLPLADPSGGGTLEVRLSRRELRARREANEQRHRDLLTRLTRLGLDPLVLESSDGTTIDRTFLDWASRRRDLRHRR